MSGATLDISEARRQFNSLDKRLELEHVVRITRHGKEVFAVVHMEYLRTILETIDIISDETAYQMLRKSLEDIRAGRICDHDDVEKELG